MIGIYKITSPSGKIYIGQSVNIKIRFSTYRNLRCAAQPRIFNSLKKHGPGNHIFEVIEECEVSELNNRERYYQDLYFVLDDNKGLNCVLTKGNNKRMIYNDEFRLKISKSAKNRKFSEETKLKMSLSGKGRIVTKETRIKISIGNLGVKKNFSEDIIKAGTERLIKSNKARIGIPKSEQTKLKLRIANLGTTCIKRQGFNHPLSKTVLCIETGIFYGSVKLASIAHEIKYHILKTRLSGKFKNNTNLIYV